MAAAANAADQETAITVAAGARYLSTASQMVRADMPLLALPQYSLNEDPAVSLGSLYPQPCITLCGSVVGAQSAPDPQAWLIAAHVVVTWSYWTPGSQGSPSGPGLPAADNTLDANILVSLSVERQAGKWEVHVDASPLCLVAAQDLNRMPIAANVTAKPAGEWKQVALRPSGAGCVLSEPPAGLPGSSVDLQAVTLYRFGVLLAVNARAHELYPNVPEATPAEVALAMQAPGS